MKYKCQCGNKSEVWSALAVYGSQFAYHELINFHKDESPVLHFKVADRFCDRCSAPLCEDCAVRKTVRLTDPYTAEIFFVTRYYCRTCAEWEEQCQS